MKKGQSLVEIAITIPLLIFLMIGVFEVGYVLRNYLVILNFSRETARYTVRPEYIHFPASEEELEDITKDITEKSKQAIWNFPKDGQVYLTHVEIDLGQPCIYGDHVYTSTSEVIFNKGYGTQIPGNWSNLILKEEERLCQNLCHECSEQEELKMCLGSGKLGTCKLPPYYIFNKEEFVAVEVFYNHHQLLGFPFISNPFTDPINLRAYTVMRYNTWGRGDASIFFKD